MIKNVKKRFDIQITEAGKTFSKTFDIDKDITLINGLMFSSNRDDLAYYRGTQKVEINGEEIFPDNYETKLLMSGLNVSPNERYYKLGGIIPGNGKVKIDYTDNTEDRLGFSTYRISLYLDCEISSQ
jgi:hypothetical protein